MAKYTSHLGLYCKDPIDDGKDTFNIQTMLNDNWEKIDKTLRPLNEEMGLAKYVLDRLKDYIKLSEKGVANGVATIGEDSKVPANQLPDMDYVKSSEKGAANGVATLDSDGNVSEEQLSIKIKKFTYTGTGKYGSSGSNRTEIGIDGFIPKLVVISNGYDVALVPIINVSGGATKGLCFSLLSESVNFENNSYAMTPIYATLVTAFYPSVTLYLYTNVTDKNQAACQMNASGTEYTVIAIGSEYTQES